MANIAKRRDGSWRARYRDGAGKEHSRHFNRKVDAQRWLDAVTTAVQTGTYVDPARSRMTVGGMAGQWLAGKVNLKPSTFALYESILGTHVLPRWRDVPLSQVEHGDVQAWIAGLDTSGLSASHVRDTVGVLSGVLGLAVRDRRLPSNPAHGADLPRIRKRRRRYLTAPEVEALANAAGPDGQLAILVLAYCGLRWCALAALRVGCVDFLRRRFVIAEAVTEVNGRLVWGSPKSHESRSVPIPRVLIDDLAVQVAGKRREDLVSRRPPVHRCATATHAERGSTALRRRSVNRASLRTSFDTPQRLSR